MEGQVNGSKVGVIIMDFARAFDSFNHDFLLAKLEAYGLNNNEVSFMRSYPTNRLQRCEINNSISEWAKMSARVPQRSIIGPLFYCFKSVTWKIMLMTVLFMPHTKVFLEL